MTLMEALKNIWVEISSMTEVFSIHNAKMLLKHIGLFGEGCLIALQIFIPVLIIGSFLGYLFGKWSYKYNFVKVIMEGPANIISTLAVVSLLFIHFPLQVMLHHNISPLVTIPIAFTLINIVISSRTVCHSIQTYHENNRHSGLGKMIISGLLMAQSTLFNTVLFLSLIIVLDIFETGAEALSVRKNDTKEIYGAFILFYALTAYAVRYFCLALKKFFYDTSNVMPGKR